MLFQCKLGGDLYPGGLFPDVFVCLQQDPWPPLPPPRLVYRDRPITGEAYKNVSVCVLGVGGGGGGGLTSESLWYLKRLSTVSSKNKERKHK